MKTHFYKPIITWLLIIIPFVNVCFGQTKPFKEVAVDLDEHRSDSILPIEEPFYLKLTSKSTFNLSDYKLVRIRTRHSYFGKNGVLYYKDIALINSSISNTTEKLPKPTKVTITTSTKKITGNPADENTNTTVSEYPLPPTPTTLYSATIFVTALTPNFYYYIIKTSNRKLSKLNLFDEIFLPTNIPLGNTALDTNENLNRHVTATFGIAYVNFYNKSVVPYLGLRYNFSPVNKWVRQGMAEMNSSGDHFLDRFAIEVGLTLNTIADSIHMQNDLLASKISLLTGIGYRISNYVYISAGPLWYKKVDNSDKTKTYIRNRFYASLSLDWDIAKTFNSFGKLLGISL